MRTGGTPAERLAIAEIVLRHAEEAGATEAEVLVDAEDAALTRFANSEIHQNVAEASVRVSLRFVRGKRVGVATTGRTDADALRRLADTAGRIAVGRAADLAVWDADDPRGIAYAIGGAPCLAVIKNGIVVHEAPAPKFARP
jgi:predicted Zn-dependent protease